MVILFYVCAYTFKRHIKHILLYLFGVLFIDIYHYILMFYNFKYYINHSEFPISNNISIF